MYNMLLRGTCSCSTWLGTGLNTLTYLSQPNQQHGWHVNGARDNPHVDESGLLGRWLGPLLTVLDACECHSIQLCMLGATPSGYSEHATPTRLVVMWAEGESANPQVDNWSNQQLSDWNCSQGNPTLSSVGGSQISSDSTR